MGELWWADLGSYSDNRQGGVRPILITSNDKNNKFSPNVNYKPLSTKTHKRLPVHTFLRAGEVDGLERDSIVLPEQTGTIGKDRLIQKIGELTHEQFARVAADAIQQEPFFKMALWLELKRYADETCDSVLLALVDDRMAQDVMCVAR